ncbi:MAG: hypothetical protein VX731_00440 [Candidatus Neomarinimicrobiota bacterium]|nr:hypothetical protein [Candidatus Neomarinimicrobiota bacterium]
MNLSLVFKIGAVWLLMWALMNMFMPDMANIYGFTLSTELKSIMRGFGVSLLSLAVLHWVIPMWSGDNMPNFGQVVGGLWVVFILMQLNDLRTNLAPMNAEFMVPVGLNVIIAALFFVYSKK